MKFMEDQNRKIRTEDRQALTIDNIKDPGQLTHNIMRSKPTTRIHQYKHIRLSEIGKMCPREYVLGFLGGQKHFSPVSFAMMQQFNIGSALHGYVQNHPEAYFGRDNFLGYWKCLACQKTRRFGTQPTDNCEYCGAHPAATEYKEWKFKISNPAPVVGMWDGILKVSKGVYRVVEIKTYMGQDKTSPDAEHLAQAACYMYFSKFAENKLPIEIDRSVGYIIYVSKKFSYSSPIRTFQVRPTERLLRPYLDKAEAVRAGFQEGILPDPLPLCVRNRWVSGRPKQCQRKEDCLNYHTKNMNQIMVRG